MMNKARNRTKVPAKYRHMPLQWQIGWLRGWNKVGNRRSY